MHEALVSYLYGEATPEEIRGVEAHLKQCSVCGEELAAFERVRSMLQQWQLDDMPIVRIAAPAQRRSALAVLREFFTVAPIWVKGLGVVAAAMLVLAVIGADISIGRDGFRMQTHLLRRDKNPAGPPTVVRTDSSQQTQMLPAMTESQLKDMISQMIAETEKQHARDLEVELVKLESGLKNSHSADVAKLYARVQQQHERIKALENDIDRREGLGLNDIFFSESGSGRRQAGASTDGEGGQ
jgi:hypothetical protein